MVVMPSQCQPYPIATAQSKGCTGSVYTASLQHCIVQVKEAARAYRVYYTKTNDDPEDYLVDHSIIMYLLDPHGQFMAFYGKEKAELSDKIAKAIA